MPQVGAGKKPDPGIYADIPNEVYHALPGVSKSMLDKLDESPAHLRDAIDNPVHEQTMPMMIGSATHCAVLQPDKFEDQYIVMSDIDGRTSEASQNKPPPMAGRWLDSGRTFRLARIEPAMIDCLVLARFAAGSLRRICRNFGFLN